MNDVELLNLAKKAASCVLRGHGTREDWEDAVQEAAYGIVKCGDRHEGYLFLAAKSAVCDWLRTWLRHRRAGTILEWKHYTPQEPPALIECLPELTRRLAEQGATQPGRDLTYLSLLLQGYSTAGIAMEMGMTQRRVYAIRERLVPRLVRMSRGELPLSRSESVKRGIVARRDGLGRDG